MRRVFISFLGKGSYNKQTEKYDYTETKYSLNNRVSSTTKFVQSAICELLLQENFDVAYILTTRDAADLHFHNLQSELLLQGVSNVDKKELSDGFGSGHYWGWFESIVGCVKPEDRIVVDITHGYRVMGLVITNAIGFILKTCDVKLEAVYYGAFEAKNKTDCNIAPIVNLKDFFVIHDWAEAVGRLVEDADARKIASMVKDHHMDQMKALRDRQLIEVFNGLSEKLRNIAIHEIHGTARQLIDIVNQKRTQAGVVAQRMLDMVDKKYARLIPPAKLTGCYDKAYFDHQLHIIRMLLEHHLFMQAFTCMREFVGSIGLVQNKEVKTGTSKGRKQRRKADVFINMLAIPENNWRFEENEQKSICDKLKPLYDDMKGAGIVDKIQKFLNELQRLRNGFDHAWTARKYLDEDIEKKGGEFLEYLKDVIKDMEANDILK